MPMTRLRSGLVGVMVLASLAAHPSIAHAHGIGAVVYGTAGAVIGGTFLLELTALSLTPYVVSAVEFANDERPSLAASAVYATFGTGVGIASLYWMGLIGRTQPAMGEAAFPATLLAATYWGMAGLGYGGLGARPRDPWIGASPR